MKKGTQYGELNCEKETDPLEQAQWNSAAVLNAAKSDFGCTSAEIEELRTELELVKNDLHIQHENNGKLKASLAATTIELQSLTYGVSHDLRAPLRAINGFAQILAQDYSEQSSDEAKALLAKVIRSSNKMSDMLTNLLELSRIGQQLLAIVEINTNQLINTVIGELKPVYPDKVFNINVKTLDNIRGDKALIKKVFTNLISNAFLYTKKDEETSIEIGGCTDNGYSTIYVKDDGIGFDMRHHEKIFGVFQRLVGNDEFKGIGAGLAIVKKIVVNHNGKVWAKAKLNVGACFYISLPQL